MNRLAIAALAVVVLAGPAGAFIPPGPPGPPPPELGWDGPGLFCGEGYTLKVEAGEFIREDLQLEPSQPLSNTVKSAKGWFTVSVSPFGSAPPDLGVLVSQDARGALYEYRSGYGQLQSFIFLFNDGRASRVEVDFWQPGFFGPEPARSSEAPFSPDERLSVVKRIDFGATCPPSCFSVRRPAGQCHA